MKYKFNLGIWSSVFCVPAVIVDKYLKLAGESDIKVLLFLLRNSEHEFSEKELAEQLHITEEQAEESIHFWQQRKILSIDESGEITPLNTEEKIVKKENSPVLAAASSSAFSAMPESLVHKVNLERIPDFPPVEIADTVRGSDEAKYLFKHCEALYGRPLKHNEQRTLMLILEDACLPVEVALILVDCCFSIKKATPAYMRATAVEWSESEINTIEKAEKRMEEMISLSSAVERFRKMFEVNSAFSKQQRDMINIWVNQYQFSDEMINEAYQITLNATGKLAFPYMNKVLSSWQDKGIKTPKQISDDSKPKSAEKGENTSFDINEIERLMLNRHNHSGGSS
ncbi:MAG: DnaD domain protein [Firmicutes bacterium]|nr:DnaD domain protein [[Eubacterium] siraeum]MCM1487813.1 DnaD domain protein [Bacillota bacterium]